MNITVSVIIVNYNAGALLAETVGRVMRSTVPVKVIISDNGSSDDSLNILKKTIKNATNLYIIENGSNLGFSVGNNIALHIASGDYLLFLNPDCLIEPDTIERLIGEFKLNPDVGMVGCLIRNLDGSEQPGCRRYIPTPWRSLMRVVKLAKVFPNAKMFKDFNMLDMELPTVPIDVDAISGAFMLVTREALEIVGPLDPEYFLHCEDLDWCMRFRQAGYRIRFIPDVIITHIKGVCSYNRQIFVEWHKHKGMIRFYRKFFKDRYPNIVLSFVYVGVWIRFLGKVTYTVLLYLVGYFFKK